MDPQRSEGGVFPLINMQKTLEHYYSDSRMVRQICRKRVAFARSNRKKRFTEGLGGGVYRAKRNEILDITPPRRVWHKCRPDKEERKNGDMPSKVASAMAEYVLRELKRSVPGPPWLSRLRDLLTQVRQEALSWKDGVIFRPTEIIPIPKKKAGCGQPYRIISRYCIKDTLLASGFSAYLRDIVDPMLGPECLAFRPLQPGSNRPPDHHDGATALWRFATETPVEVPLYVAECDIRGFYDCVAHEVARRRVNQMLSRSAFHVDDRLRSFIDSFFNGYDFVETAVPEATQALRKVGIKCPKFPTPRIYIEALGLASPKGGIGLPQGSYMSCVLANVILAEADARCTTELRVSGRPDDGLYLRYCDDIVILAKSFELCQQVMEIYTGSLKRLALPFHQPFSVRNYSRRYWSRKSKSTYEWGMCKGQVPWVGFVGYQVRRDGLVRVRRTSIAKEMAKQDKVVTECLRRIRVRHKREGKTILVPPVSTAKHRLMMHLVAIGVGYPKARKVVPSPTGVSWSKGFRVLQGVPIDNQGLRRLDAGRYAALKKFEIEILHLKKKGLIAFKQAPKCQGQTQGRRRAPFRLEFDGPPFSYARQFGQSSETIPKDNSDDT
jgi:hypothetical protein